LTTLGFMAREVMLPQLFPARRFESVLAHSQIAEQAGMILGPLLAAVVLAHAPWSLAVVAAALLFLGADAATWLWRRCRPVPVEAVARVAGGTGDWLRPLATALGHIRRLPELRRIIVLAAGVNLIVGITLATSAAMTIGVLRVSPGGYAWLQTAGAVATVAVLFAIAHVRLALSTLGLCACLALLAGGVLTALAAGPLVYAFGYVLICGFDKMFNIYLRSLRQRVIPPHDFGKTAGVVTLLNNLTQPLAGLLVGAGAGHFGLPALILGCTATMAGLCVLVVLRRRSAQ
jgi:thiosulfate reductase cytochrome b subunit